ncbi:MAG: Hsp20/alpha crystallin family protein [Solirubrobacterales bacterium]|nr:Hsp20/alpha crystallin family protein [Solirubrobacterales bacterium]
MALVRWEPAREMNTLQSEVNRLFSTFFDSPAAPQGALRRWVPAMDLIEMEDHFLLKADLPGMSEADVNIEVEGDTLTISGERKEEHESREGGFVRLERAAGAFSRSLTLPDGVDPEGVKASFKNGVLEVYIPKPEQTRPRRVSIAVGDRPQDVEGERPQAAAQDQPQQTGAGT